MKQIYNIILVGKLQRTSHQIDEVTEYLRRTIPSLAKADNKLLQMLVEKIQVFEYSKGQKILEQGKEDDVQIIVLEGSVSKIRDGRVLSTFNCDQCVCDDICSEQSRIRKIRKFFV